MQLKTSVNNIIAKLIHRPEEALDIQSELIFVNGMPRNKTLANQQLSFHQLHHPTPQGDSRSDVQYTGV